MRSEFFLFSPRPPTSRPRLRLKSYTLHTRILFHNHVDIRNIQTKSSCKELPPNPNPCVTNLHVHTVLIPVTPPSPFDDVVRRRVPGYLPSPPPPARDRDGGGSSRRSRRDSRSRSSGRDGRSNRRRGGEDRGRSSSGRGRRGGGEDDRDKKSSRSGRAGGGGGGSKQAKPPLKAEKKVGCGNSAHSRRRYFGTVSAFWGALWIGREGGVALAAGGVVVVGHYGGR